MERDAHTAKTIAPNPDRIVLIMPWPGLAQRLSRALGDTSREFDGGLISYLRYALLPDRVEDWFPIKFTKLVWTSLAHPLETIEGALAVDPIDAKRKRRFRAILAAMTVVYFGLGLYVAYLAFFSQFAHLRVVDRAYKKFDPDTILAKLYYPPQMLRAAPTGPAMTIEEIRARAEKHKKELALARAKIEKEKKEREEAERKVAEETAKVAAAAAAQNKPAAPTAIGEINIAPIRDTVGNLYKLFDAGGLDIPEMKFSMMAGFKVMPDGSFENIKMLKSSGSKIIDKNAIEILHNLGESHALGQVSDLSSATISLDITDDLARIRIMAFAPTPEVAKAKSNLLNLAFWGLGLKERGTELGQLLKLIKVKSEGKRVDTDLIVPKAQAAQMFRAWSSNPGTPPQ